MVRPNGALNESIAAGSDLIREAQRALDGIAPNHYTDALFPLGDALREMFDQLRVCESAEGTFVRLSGSPIYPPGVSECRRLKSARCRRKSGRVKNLLARGAAALTDPELIAILLRTGVPGANAVEVARKLIKQYGSLAG